MLLAQDLMDYVIFHELNHLLGSRPFREILGESYAHFTKRRNAMKELVSLPVRGFFMGIDPLVVPLFWDEQGVPFSTVFLGDKYFCADNGYADACHVFLKGNQLPATLCQFACAPRRGVYDH